MFVFFEKTKIQAGILRISVENKNYDIMLLNDLL